MVTQTSVRMYGVWFSRRRVKHLAASRVHLTVALPANASTLITSVSETLERRIAHAALVSRVLVILAHADRR